MTQMEPSVASSSVLANTAVYALGDPNVTVMAPTYTSVTGTWRDASGNLVNLVDPEDTTLVASAMEGLSWTFDAGSVIETAQIDISLTTTQGVTTSTRTGVVDSAREVITWEDGDTWQRWPLTARMGHSASVHASAGAVFVWGGFDGQALRDLWKLTLATGVWEVQEQAGIGGGTALDSAPAARDHHSGEVVCLPVHPQPSASPHLVPFTPLTQATCSDDQALLVVFGGQLAGSVVSSELRYWFVHNSTWDSGAPSLTSDGDGPPAARSHHSSVVYTSTDAEGTTQCILVFGGRAGSALLGDLWRACPRLGSAAFGDSWTWDGTWTWTRLNDGAGVTGTAPSSRYGSTASLVVGRMILFGGYNGQFPNDYLNDGFEFDPVALRWRDVTATGTPDARTLAAAAVVSSADPDADLGSAAIVMLGGRDRYIPRGDLHVGDALVPVCDPGEASSSGLAADCLPCAAGEYSLGAAYACTPCSPGTYQESAGMGSCDQCPPGTYSTAEGADDASTCGLCPSGFATAEWGSDELSDCGECGAGTFSSADRSECTACGVGEAQPSPGSGSCDPCDPGFYSDTPGLADCIGCAEGLYGPVTGMTGCLTCPAGHWSDEEATECNPCAAGTYNPLPGGALANCTDCLAGSYADVAGAVVCKLCPPGTSGAVNASDTLDDCMLCDSGSFAAGAGNSGSCDACPPGSFADSPGATSCELCPVATYRTATGGDDITDCAACPDSTVTPSPGGASLESQCVACAAGTYFDNVTALFHNPGDASYAQCLPCPPGSTSAGGTDVVGIDACIVCDAATYATDYGSPLCAACAAESSSAAGWAQCAPCSSDAGCATGPDGSDCSGHGSCLFGHCDCDAGWEGVACEIEAGGCGGGCAGVFQFAATEVTGAEGESVDVVVTRKAGTDGAVAVDIDVQTSHSEHTAASDVDYTAADFPMTLNFADGVASVTASISIPSDGTPGEGCDVLALELDAGSATGGSSVGVSPGDTFLLRIEEGDASAAELSRVSSGASEAVEPTSLEALVGDETVAVTLTVSTPAAGDAAANPPVPRVPEGDGPPLDILLLQDLSAGSADNLVSLEQQMPHALATLRSTLQADVAFGAAWFSDIPYDLASAPPFGTSGDSPFDLEAPVDRNLAGALDAIKGMTVKNGGDSPGAQLTALLAAAKQASTVGWRDGSRRMALVASHRAFHEAGDASSELPVNDGDGIADNIVGTDNAADEVGFGTGEDYPSPTQVRDACVETGVVPVFAVETSLVATYQALLDSYFGFGLVLDLDADGANIGTVLNSAISTLMDEVDVVAESSAASDASRLLSVSGEASGVAPDAEVALTVTLDGCDGCARTDVGTVRLFVPFHGHTSVSLLQAVDDCVAASPTPPSSTGWSGFARGGRVAQGYGIRVHGSASAALEAGVDDDSGNAVTPSGPAPLWAQAVNEAVDEGAYATMEAASESGYDAVVPWEADADAADGQGGFDPVLRLFTNGTFLPQDAVAHGGSGLHLVAPTVAASQTYALGHVNALPLVLRAYGAQSNDRAAEADGGAGGLLARIDVDVTYADGSTHASVLSLSFGSSGAAHGYEFEWDLFMPAKAVASATLIASVVPGTSFTFPSHTEQVPLPLPNATCPNATEVNITADGGGLANATNATECFVNMTQLYETVVVYDPATFTGSAWFAGVGLFVAPEAACACEAGQFAIVNGKVVGLEGAAELDSIAGATTCDRCPISFECNAGTQKQCGDGLYSYGAFAACLPCFPGWTCVQGVATPCDLTDYVKDDHTCEPCTPGYECHGGVRTPCAAGFFSPIAGGTACLPCLPGTATNETAAKECAPCPEGHTAGHGRSVCAACRAGETADQGEYPCRTCPRGTFSTAGGQCEPCESGSYNPHHGNSECYSCPADRPNTAGPGAEDESECTA